MTYLQRDIKKREENLLNKEVIIETGWLNIKKKEEESFQFFYRDK